MSSIALVPLIRRTALLLAVAVATAHAHDSRPLYVELAETGAGVYRLEWKVPSSIPSRFAPTVIMPAGCDARGMEAVFSVADGLIRRSSYHCRSDLSEKALTIHHPGPNPALSTLIRYMPLSGERQTVVLGPQEVHWAIPARQTVSGVAMDYARLGIGHIWTGYDHLLFVACLLWIAATPRRILLIITGFTLSHSITLAASALRAVQLPTAPVEASIALSIVFVAREIVRGRSDSLTWQHPILVSSSFGLLHGFGFAAALSAVGLPKTELLAGLVAFNVGVEIGQVVFAGAIMLGVFALRRGWDLVRIRLPVLVTKSFSLQLVAGWIAGSVAAYWFVERVVRFIPQSS